MRQNHGWNLVNPRNLHIGNGFGMDGGTERFRHTPDRVRNGSGSELIADSMNRMRWHPPVQLPQETVTHLRPVNVDTDVEANG